MFLLFAPTVDLLKAALPPGARWITVHPHGPGSDGQPVLIEPSGHDGAFRVIGGAGGKLNYLKLRGVRSEADYKAEASQWAASAKDEKKRQRERDREAGLNKSKSAAREVLKASVGDQEAKFVDTVAKALGWTEEQMRFPAEKFQNLSEPALKKLQDQHAKALVRKAQEAVDQQRKRLLQDAETRAESGLGEVPLTAAAPDQLSVQDIAPVDEGTKGFGYSTDYKGRSEAKGLTPEALAQEAADVRGPEMPEQTAKRATGEKIAAELKTIRDPAPQLDPHAEIDAKKAVELLKAEKALRNARREARDKGKQIDSSPVPVEPKAYIIEEGGPVDQDVVKDLESDLRTMRTRSFLQAAKAEAGGDIDSLNRYVGVGAFNSVNAVALAAAGASLVDRSVVDVLGIAGAAQVLSRRLQKDLTPEEMAQVREAMESFHVDHYMKLSDQALRDARAWHEMAHEIEIGEAATGADLAVAQELNARRREYVGNARSILGTALGEMESNAALVVALGQPAKNAVQVSLGTTPIEQAIQQARAIGLDRGDYQIERAGASTILTVNGEGLDKLARPVSRADMEQVNTALDIINGRQDEENWLPLGVASRPDLAMNPQPGVAPRLAAPFPSNPSDMKTAVENYIGGRMADGDAPADIVSGLLSAETQQRAGDRGAFLAAVQDIAPFHDDKGKLVRAEAYQDGFEKLADAFVERQGTNALPLHRQQIKVDDHSVEALHRALAEHPDGITAFKPVGDLTAQDEGAIRNAFMKEYGRIDPESDRLRAELEKITGQEPEQEIDDMFGRGTNPEWSDWKKRRDETAEALNKATMTWGKYVEVMGSPQKAYAAMQDVIRSKVLRSFAETHNTLTPQSPLKVGKAVIANDLDHLTALDPAARDRRLAEQAKLIDSLRNRVRGQYASGAISDKLDAARQQEAAAAQAQMGLFAEPAAPAELKGTPLAMGERYTLGHAAERQIAGMVDVMGRNFKPGQPTKLWSPTFSGKYAPRQRAVKLIEHDKHVALGMGMGSGKTSIMLSGFSHLHEQGKAGKGLFLVPSIVQGQFHGEALQVLQPGKFHWAANPGASREERIASYKDPGTHFCVVTHQAFRDDMIHLAGKRDGLRPKEVLAKLRKMEPADRSKYMRDLMQAEGIPADYMAVDEGHNLLNRAGKENSDMADVIDAVSGSMPYYVNASADPIKNDPSEAFDLLRKMDPARYRDRDEFMRKYGVGTGAAQDGLKREMARHLYTGSVDPGVKADKKQVQVELSDHEHGALKALDDAAGKLRVARIRGTVDVAAAKALSPSSFAGIEPGREEDVAKQIQESVGIVHSSAVNHAISGPAKIEALAKLAGEHKGKPGVVFAHSLDRVNEIANRLRAEGHHVITITGGESTKEKDARRRQYKEGGGVLVCSDAGAVGANLQTGKWLAQFDTPMTAMVHSQRNGRIHRIGQTEDVKLFDLVANHPAERRARDRLAKKYDLRSIMTSPMDGLDDTGVAGYLNRVRAGQHQADQPSYVPSNGEGADLPADVQASMF